VSALDKSLQKFLEMVLQLPHLTLEIMFGCRDILLTRVIIFLIVTIISGRNGDMLRVSLLPLLAALGTLLSAIDGGLERCYSATAGGYFHVAQDKGGPNCLLARGVLSGNVE
jgi:hypothetical protein